MYFTPSIFNNQSLTCGMTTTSDMDFYGISSFGDTTDWVKNRIELQNRFCQQYKIYSTHQIIAMQTHSSQIEYIDRERLIIAQDKHEHDSITIQTPNLKEITGIMVNADGLYTNESNLLLAVAVADCAGIVLYSPNELFLVLHSGWRATAGVDENGQQGKSIVQRAIEEVISQNISLDSLLVWVSPCAKSCCYQIGEEIIPYFQKYPLCIHQSKSKYTLDIAYYIHQQLLDYGVHQSHIEISPHCTICNTQFHSHRRSIASGNNLHKRSLVFACKS